MRSKAVCSSWSPSGSESLLEASSLAGYSRSLMVFSFPRASHHTERECLSARLLRAHRLGLSGYSPECVEVDFSHLETKGEGYARHQSRLKEVIEMRTLPPKMLQVLASFAPLFSKRVWQHAQLLLVGAILAPGRRTVGSALRAMG